MSRLIATWKTPKFSLNRRNLHSDDVEDISRNIKETFGRLRVSVNTQT